MSFSKEHSIYYLTEEGWINTRRKCDGQKKEEIVQADPKEYLLKCKYSEKISYWSRPIVKSVSEIERCGEKSEIEKLLKKYGNCPQSIYRRKGYK